MFYLGGLNHASHISPLFSISLFIIVCFSVGITDTSIGV